MKLVSGPCSKTNTSHRKLMEGSTMGKHARVSLVLTAIAIIVSVTIEWSIRHLTEQDAHTQQVERR